MQKVTQSINAQIESAISSFWPLCFSVRRCVVRESRETKEQSQIFTGNGGMVLSGVSIARIDIPSPAKAASRTTFRNEFLTCALESMAHDIDHQICKLFVHAANEVQVRKERETVWSWLNRIESLVLARCPEQSGEVEAVLIVPYDVYASMRAALIEQFGIYESQAHDNDTYNPYLRFHGLMIFRSHAMRFGKESGWDGPGLGFTASNVMSVLRPPSEDEIPEELMELPKTLIHAERPNLLVEAYFQESSLPELLVVYLVVAHDLIVFNPKTLIPVSWYGMIDAGR